MVDIQLLRRRRSDGPDLQVLGGAQPDQPSSSPTGQRLRVLVGAAAVVALVVGILVWRSDRTTQEVQTEPDRSIVTSPEPAVEPTPADRAALVERRGRPVTAMTEAGYLVWGGGRLVLT